MMPQAPSQAEQKVVFLNFDTTLPADTCVALTGDGQEFAFTLPIETANLVYSSPELTDGGTYTVSYGGTYSGDNQDGICSGGSYSGGTELTEVTLTEDITTYGNAGMGGGMGGGPGGGFDGKGGKGGMGGKNDTGDRPELPDNGTAPNQGDGGTPPELPDGGTAPDQGDGGTPPELPDGENMPDRDGKGERPELPDGGNMPDRGGRGERPGQTEQNKT
jgi:hypothetical protein